MGVSDGDWVFGGVLPHCQRGGGDWLTDGGTYVVLEVGADPGGRTWLRVEPDGGTPGIFDARCFVLTDSAVPTTWQAELRNNGSLTFGPAGFLRPDFWEAFFDREPEAETVYGRVVGHPRSD